MNASRSEPLVGKLFPCALAAAFLCHFLPWLQISGLVSSKASAFQSNGWQGTTSGILVVAAAILYAMTFVAKLPKETFRFVTAVVLGMALFAVGLQIWVYTQMGVPEVPELPLNGSNFGFQALLGSLRVEPLWGLHLAVLFTLTGLVLGVSRLVSNS